MKALFIFALLLFSSVPALAGPKKIFRGMVSPFLPQQSSRYDTPQPRALPTHFYRDPKWLLGEFFILASVGMDAYSTVLRTGPIIEGNRFLGQNPSRPKVISVACLSAGLQTTYHAAIWHYYLADGREPRGWKTVEYTAIPLTSTVIYGYYGAVHNFELEFPKLKANLSLTGASAPVVKH